RRVAKDAAQRAPQRIEPRQADARRPQPPRSEPRPAADKGIGPEIADGDRGPPDHHFRAPPGRIAATLFDRRPDKGDVLARPVFDHQTLQLAVDFKNQSTLHGSISQPKSGEK